MLCKHCAHLFYFSFNFHISTWEVLSLYDEGKNKQPSSEVQWRRTSWATALKIESSLSSTLHFPHHTVKWAHMCNVYFHCENMGSAKSRTKEISRPLGHIETLSKSLTCLHLSLLKSNLRRRIMLFLVLAQDCKDLRIDAECEKVFRTQDVYKNGCTESHHSSLGSLQDLE